MPREAVTLNGSSLGLPAGDNKVSHTATDVKNSRRLYCTNAARFQPHLNILLNISAETAKTAGSCFAPKSSV